MHIRLIVTYVLIYLSIILLGCASKAKWVPNLPEDIGAAGDGKLGYVLEYIRDSYYLPSLRAMVIVSGQIAEAEAIGFRKLGAEVQVTRQDRWHLGSNGKAITARLAAIFVERGDLSWNTRIGDILLELVGKIRPEYVDVPLSELLSHTDGLPSYGSMKRVSSWYSFFNNSE
jgi:CubicO group peptidase (beta-lactamase class C family)